LRLATLMPEAVPHVTIEIRDTRQRELVTAMAILSPTNKRGEGRREFVTKRQRLLLSAVHLIEIDLLHMGTGTELRAIPSYVPRSRLALPLPQCQPLHGPAQWVRACACHPS
jgi:hypothetical protein